MSIDLTAAKRSWVKTCQDSQFLQSLCGERLLEVVSYLTDGLETIVSQGVQEGDENLQAELAATRVGHDKWVVDLLLPHASEKLSEILDQSDFYLRVHDKQKQLLHCSDTGTCKSKINDIQPVSTMHVVSSEGQRLRTGLDQPSSNHEDKVRQSLLEAMRARLTSVNDEDPDSVKIVDQTVKGWKETFDEMSENHFRLAPGCDTTIGCHVLDLPSGKQALCPTWSTRYQYRGGYKIHVASSTTKRTDLCLLRDHTAPVSSRAPIFNGDIFFGPASPEPDGSLSDPPSSVSDQEANDTNADVDMTDAADANETDPKRPLRLTVHFRAKERADRNKRRGKYTLDPEGVSVHPEAWKPDAPGDALSKENQVVAGEPVSTHRFAPISINQDDSVDMVIAKVKSRRTTYKYQDALEDSGAQWRRRSEETYIKASDETWSASAKSLADKLSALGPDRPNLKLHLAQTHHQSPKRLNHQDFLYGWWELKGEDGTVYGSSTDPDVGTFEPSWLPRGR